jgi:hypothetical protein
MANEDVTTLREELSELHYETLTTELSGDRGGEIAEDYAKALDAYDRAKQLLRTTEGSDVGNGCPRASSFRSTGRRPPRWTGRRQAGKCGGCRCVSTQYGADVSSPANQLNRSGGGFL